MATIKTILVPLDLTDGRSEATMDYARTLSDALGASLHLLHVVCHPMDGPDARAAHYTDACARMERLLEPADRDRRLAKSTCVFGAPAPEIARYAIDHAVDLIVMGTHTHGPSFQMFGGSIAENVIGMVPCAVLTVKAHGDVPNGALAGRAATTAGA